MSDLTLTMCKRRLATLWLAGSGIAFFSFVVKTLTGFYNIEVPEGAPDPHAVQDAWSWFLPSVLPTLSLIVGVLVADAKAESKDDALIDSFIFKLAYRLSIAYLAFLIGTIWLPFNREMPLDSLKTSSLWLAPIQGLASAALGAFFLKAQPRVTPGLPAKKRRSRKEVALKD
jgi:hypothetical protein